LQFRLEFTTLEVDYGKEEQMNTYFFFGCYSESALREISAKRTEKSAETFKKFGGQVKSVYALLGEHDLVIIAEVPGTEAAMQISMALQKLTGISFTTAPAVPVEQFDKLAAQV
jgi:uncharacterized protein with GYD domain